MVSTSEAHHKKNSGLSLEEYWKMCETYIKKAHQNGIKVCGTVSTIWGCPIAGPTELKHAVEFTKRFLDLGADDIEHADHDGSASPDKVFDYFSMVLKDMPDPKRHVAHFHVTRGWGLATSRPLPGGITHFEGTMAARPARQLLVDGSPVAGTGKHITPTPA